MRRTRRLRNSPLDSFGFGIVGIVIMWVLMFLVAATVGHFTITYILGAFFGDVASWLALPIFLRGVIGAVLAGPSIPAAIITFIVSLFVSTPFL